MGTRNHGMSQMLQKSFIRTKHPVAVNSIDHRFPRGTINDNSVNPLFVDACLRHFPRPRMLDLGCAGGGMVALMCQTGIDSIGVEGSDINQKTKRAEWGGQFADHLFTADITKPFQIVDELSNQRKFKIITAWEVLEHIAESDLFGLIENIKSHLANNGLFVASVSMENQSDTPEIIYHQTVRSKQWWIDRFCENGLIEVASHQFRHTDFVRGNGRGSDVDVAEEPHKGFHLILRKE